MPYSHLRWWRVLSVVTVLVLWTDAVLNGFGAYDILLALVMPLIMWSMFWRAGSPLVRNAHRTSKPRSP